MISKHVDLIAIAILLVAIAVFSGAKHVVVMTMRGPVQYFRLDGGRQVHIPSMPQMPRPPRIPLQRD